MNTTIVSAIRHRNVIQFRYHNRERVAEPYAYGRDKDGAEVMRSFQVSGGSEGGQRTGWKLFKVAEIQSLLLIEDCFTIRSDYKPNDKTIVTFYAQV